MSAENLSLRLQAQLWPQTTPSCSSVLVHWLSVLSYNLGGSLLPQLLCRDCSEASKNIRGKGGGGGSCRTGRVAFQDQSQREGSLCHLERGLHDCFGSRTRGLGKRLGFRSLLLASYRKECLRFLGQGERTPSNSLICSVFEIQDAVCVCVCVAKLCQ